MTIEDIYTNLPAEPDLAFVHLEKAYRSELDQALSSYHGEGPVPNAWYLAYMNQTLAAARALGLQVFDAWQVPRQRDNIWGAYQDFSAEVEHYLVQIKIRHGRRISGHSIALDAATRLKIHHHIEQIREIVLKLEVVPAKQEALIARLTALSDEVDRDRTRMDVIAAFVLEIATTTGEATQRMKPLSDAVARLLGLARDAENARASLLAPAVPKQLVPPRQPKLETSSGQSWDAPKGGDLDDEIPF